MGKDTNAITKNFEIREKYPNIVDEIDKVHDKERTLIETYGDEHDMVK